ncbi:hypothetical protein DLM75_09545 [Leptospira stimsonii]|uniref:Uncharacterized protein n=1 Tax=Leptospira stimsonii TaxID=2202203 RepID=A0A396ZC43_9LEPT|nr:hypothetical protein DLM75_09545 [Leptospira stimsonii]
MLNGKNEENKIRKIRSGINAIRTFFLLTLAVLIYTIFSFFFSYLLTYLIANGLAEVLNGFLNLSSSCKS